MAHKPLARDISVTTQIMPNAVPASRGAGFGSIINCRPDDEEPGQPRSADLEASARAGRIDYHHVPVEPGRFRDADIDAFCFAMASCDKPVLAFCKSGMRAASLWALSQAGKRTTEEILREAMACGYDLTPLVPRIEARAKAVRD